jgi:hypothetical protein
MRKKVTLSDPENDSPLIMHFCAVQEARNLGEEEISKLYPLVPTCLASGPRLVYILREGE